MKEQATREYIQRQVVCIKLKIKTHRRLFNVYIEIMLYAQTRKYSLLLKLLQKCFCIHITFSVLLSSISYLLLASSNLTQSMG